MVEVEVPWIVERSEVRPEDRDPERPAGFPKEKVLDVTVMGLIEDRGFRVAEEEELCDLIVLSRLEGLVIPTEDFSGDGGETSVGLGAEAFPSVVGFNTEGEGDSKAGFVFAEDSGTVSVSLTSTFTLVTIGGGGELMVRGTISTVSCPVLTESDLLSTFIDSSPIVEGSIILLVISSGAGAVTLMTFL